MGTWRLEALGESPLPVTCLPFNCAVHSQFGMLGRRVDVLGSSLSFTAGTGWSETFDLDIVTDVGRFRQSRTISGTYRHDGALVSLSADGDPAYLICERIAQTLTCDDGRARYSR